LIHRGPDYAVTREITCTAFTKTITLAVESHASLKDPWGNQRMAFPLHQNPIEGLRAHLERALETAACWSAKTSNISSIYVH